MKFLLIIASVLITSLVNAQHGGGKPSGFEGEVYGVVKDSVTNGPLEYVIVKLLSKDSAQMGAMVTNSKGEFSLPVSKKGEYIVRIDFIGFQTRYFDKLKFDEATTVHDLGNVSLTPNMMEDVVVRGDKPLVSYEIDKKVVNVDDQNTNQGQTAIEILQNVPSISVDSDGNISLRGSSSFTLLINGVPTAMDATNALTSIPASSIENIEIITNPSAKYDAEGAAGIINIITKKKKLEGVSMLLNASAGNFDNYSSDVAVSIGKEKFIFNFGGNYNTRHRPRDIEKDRIMYLDSSTSRIQSEGYGAWKTYGWGFNAEIQYEPNSAHVFIINTDLNNRMMIPYFYLNFQEYSDGVLEQEYLNKQDNIIDIDGLTSSFYYQHRIKRDRNHTITLKAINSLRAVDQLDSAVFYNNNGEIIGGSKYTEVGPSNFNRFNIDYARKLEKMSIEAGVQTQLGYSADDGKSYLWDSTSNQFVFNPQFSSTVDYYRDVHAGYAIVRGKKEKLGYQLGLRAEYTYRKIIAPNFPEFATIKRLDWFPSAHFSYDMKKKLQILANYSRRIQRPRSWYFEPFITWETAFNVRSGNPDLTPEYINSFELSAIRQFEDRGYMSLETYYKFTDGVIERVSTTYQEDVIITRPYNIGRSTAIGAEPSVQLFFKEWWEVNAGVNLFYFNLTGEIDEVPFNNESFNVKARLTNTFKVEKGWQFQLVGEYNSPTATPQGDQKGFYTIDASIRKAFSDGKYALNLQANNLFRSRIDHVTIITDDLYLLRYNTPRGPMVTLTFTMKLNNYKKVMSRHEATDDF